ncbi:DUF1120 domain-containing protein [Oceanisphaera sp. KMM 10153]|uniref:DUF1120 domain-containing protein n=1 Tax=Oceanisphaera submarina TaxID=3390193 RepID=UPI0039770FF2
MRFATRLSALALAGAGMVAAAGAQAQSMDVSVTGTVTPPACAATLGGGVVDYGRILVSTLSETELNPLPEKAVPFSIACGVATRVAMRSVDNRSASQVAGILRGISTDFVELHNFGLGTVGGARVGGYLIHLRQGTFTADGASVFTVHSGNNNAGWGHTRFGTTQHRSDYSTSWSATEGGRPLAFRNLSGNLVVQAVLNRGDALPLQDEVPLDGLATLEMLYL